MKISQRVSELLRGYEIMTDGQTDGQRQTDGQMEGQGDYYRSPPTSSGGDLMKGNGKRRFYQRLLQLLKRWA